MSENKKLKNEAVKNLARAAMFVALGLVLPFFTGQLPHIGSMLLPMHIPVLLCGLICGWRYGLVVGFVLPLLRNALFGMPPLFPTGVAMAFELAAYGFLAGWLYAHSRWQCVIALYRCLITAMLGGRLVWGGVMLIICGINGSAFTWQLFISGALLSAIPGIILQLLAIPAIMVALDKAGLVYFQRNHSHSKQTLPE